ncbi:LacI family DNA-binding transcriptional regulator [Gordonia sihwensis]|uniref:LacI family DNA-binding transcriptional regulator n=1 Tax=Gordonia sihwensis TaxID=173559 RepID=UPI0005F03E6A|nr:LacI family DNA-binding transcriptional regulator [Gordonia sihwensis]KJR08549.1 LacI family transcriptional regulator [Gordonia sihwensis]
MTDHSGPRRTRPPTMKEIAERAGVHVSTVSRVLRQTEPVDGWSEAAKRVREVAQELGYQPNLWAASLRTRRTTTIGAVMPRLTDGVVATVYQGVEQAAREASYSVLLSSPPDDPDAQRQAIELLTGRQVDGLILSSLHSPAAEFVRRLKLTVPAVALNRHAGSGLPFAGGDDRLGGALAGRHLLDCGYRRIAAVGGPLFATTGHDRLSGFLDAMSDAGVRIPDHRIAHARMDVQGGIDAARSLLTRDDRPDAVFCVSDTMAIGLLGVARDLRLSIPGDLGVVGYNDIPVAAQLPVPLTTVVTPAHEIGAAGVRLLLGMVSGTDPQPDDVRLPVRLVVRGSTVQQR